MEKFTITFEFKAEDLKEVQDALTDLFTLDRICDCFGFETTVLKTKIQ